MSSFWYIVFTSVLYVGQYYLERYYGRGTRGQSRTLLERLRTRLLAEPAITDLKVFNDPEDD